MLFGSHEAGQRGGHLSGILLRLLSDLQICEDYQGGGSQHPDANEWADAEQGEPGAERQLQSCPLCRDISSFSDC